MATVGERIYARLVMAGQRIAGLARIYIFRLAVKIIILCAWFAEKALRIGEGLGDYVASLIGVGAALLCVLVIPDAQIGRIVDRMNELHFACAGLIGTIFTLVLTLSVIPAQRAAEAFSPGVLGLYRDNITIKTVSLYLAAAAIGSAFLGLGWTFGLSPRYTLGFQFVILGTALDAVRWLYRRILDLFNPMVAAELLRRKIEGDIKKFDRYVKRVASLVHMTQIGPLQATRDNLIRSLLYQRSGRARDHIRSSIDHLLELGIRAIKRQDSYGAREALNAMAGVAVTYMDLRRTSLVLMPNIDLPLSLQGTSGLEEVLVPIYEAVKSVNDEAARQGDERVVQGAVMALGKVSRYAMTVISKGNNGVNRAPLVYFSVDTLGACVESAWRKGMTEAAWDTVGHLAELLKGRQAKVHTWEADTKAVEILRNIALWDYLSRPNPVVGVRAVEALLDAALHDLQLRDGAKDHFFDVVIEAIDMVVGPATKISAFSFDLFPAYSEMRQASMQGLVQFAASRVKPANSLKTWIDPFKSFDEVAKRVQMHFRKLAAENDFGSALFLKWVLRSLSECTAAVIDLSVSPPQGSERWIETLDRRLSWLVAAFPWFFHQKETVSPGRANDACEELACLAIRLMEIGKGNLAGACADGIGTIIQDYCATGSAAPHWIADLLMNLELVARAAEILGYGDLAATVRAQKKRPNALTESGWSESLVVLARRIEDFDYELREPHGANFLDGPSAELWRLMQKGG